MGKGDLTRYTDNHLGLVQGPSDLEVQLYSLPGLRVTVRVRDAPNALVSPINDRSELVIVDSWSHGLMMLTQAQEKNSYIYLVHT